MKNSALFVLMTMLAACSNAQTDSRVKTTDEKTLLGLNDVSILLPFNEIKELKEKALSYRALGADGNALVPDWILTAIDKELRDDIDLRVKEYSAAETLEERTADQDEFLRAMDGGPDAEQVRLNPFPSSNTFLLTSVRFDPCANAPLAKKDVDCVQEMRFVWTESHEKFGLRDSNIHAIYKLSRTEFQEIVTSLRLMVKESGVDTTKEPLQVHPVIAKQGLEGNYYKGLMAIVSRYARLSNLTHIAFLKDTMGGLQGHWPMVKFGVNEGQAVREGIVGARVGAGETAKFVQRMNGERGTLGIPTPMHKIADSIFPEFAAGTGRFDEGLHPKKIESSFRVENPKLHGVHDLDCASCHQAQTERNLVDPDGKVVSKKAYMSKNWNLSLTTEISDSTALQIFSYFNSTPRIAPRAINESAEAADRIRDFY